MKWFSDPLDKSRFIADDRLKKFPEFMDGDCAFPDPMEVLDFLLPTKLGRGNTRSTYSLAHSGVSIFQHEMNRYLKSGKGISDLSRRHYVLKIAHLQASCSSYQGIRDNMNEFETWNMYQDNHDVAKWLAPVSCISNCGKFLIAQRTEHLHGWDEMPDEIPDFLDDVMPFNFGWIGYADNRRIVCHDYACFDHAKIQNGKFGFNTKTYLKQLAEDAVK